jgi:predicted HTH transcriptional regulator
LTGDAPKNEFRADVSSFANASGGHLVIGMAEKEGYPTDLCGMDMPNPDAFKMQVDEVIQSKITPRIPRYGVRVIELANGKSAAIISISKSFAKPHQITVNKDDFQFWARNSAGKYRLGVDELRSVILQSETLNERIRNFRLERLKTVCVISVCAVLRYLADISVTEMSHKLAERPHRAS